MKWPQPLVHHGVATTYILPERRLLTNYSKLDAFSFGE